MDADVPQCAEMDRLSRIRNRKKSLPFLTAGFFILWLTRLPIY